MSEKLSYQHLEQEIRKDLDPETQKRLDESLVSLETKQLLDGIKGHQFSEDALKDIPLISRALKEAHTDEERASLLQRFFEAFGTNEGGDTNVSQGEPVIEGEASKQVIEKKEAKDRPTAQEYATHNISNNGRIPTNPGAAVLSVVMGLGDHFQGKRIEFSQQEKTIVYEAWKEQVQKWFTSQKVDSSTVNLGSLDSMSEHDQVVFQEFLTTIPLNRPVGPFIAKSIKEKEKSGVLSQLVFSHPETKVLAKNTFSFSDFI